MVSEDNVSSIRLSKQTIVRLKRYGEYGDSMDSIVKKLLDKIEKK